MVGTTLTVQCCLCFRISFLNFLDWLHTWKFEALLFLISLSFWRCNIFFSKTCPIKLEKEKRIYYYMNISINYFNNLMHIDNNANKLMLTMNFSYIFVNALSPKLPCLPRPNSIEILRKVKLPGLRMLGRSSIHAYIICR